METFKQMNTIYARICVPSNFKSGGNNDLTGLQYLRNSRSTRHWHWEHG